MGAITKKSLLQSLILCLILLSSIAYAKSVDDSAIKEPWGYQGDVGPDRWGKLSESFLICYQGKFQSPINIPHNVYKVSGNLTINYQPAPMIITQDGVTNLTIGKRPILIKDGRGIQLNFPYTKESVAFEGKEYHLIQLHLHTPSENSLHGTKFPMEIHFVHQSEDGEIAVMAVFVKNGEVNPDVDAILRHLPKSLGREYVIRRTKINPEDLLPMERDYYNFQGSLTTPPCTEGVRWIVMANPITATPDQILQLRNATGENARPIQALNGRDVLRSGVK